MGWRDSRLALAWAEQPSCTPEGIAEYCYCKVVEPSPGQEIFLPICFLVGVFIFLGRYTIQWLRPATLTCCSELRAARLLGDRHGTWLPGPCSPSALCFKSWSFSFQRTPRNLISRAARESNFNSPPSYSGG